MLEASRLVDPTHTELLFELHALWDGTDSKKKNIDVLWIFTFCAIREGEKNHNIFSTFRQPADLIL